MRIPLLTVLSSLVLRTVSCLNCQIACKHCCLLVSYNTVYTVCQPVCLTFFAVGRLMLSLRSLLQYCLYASVPVLSNVFLPENKKTLLVVTWRVACVSMLVCTNRCDPLGIDYCQDLLILVSMCLVVRQCVPLNCVFLCYSLFIIETKNGLFVG